MKLGIDLDGVLIDHLPVWKRVYNERKEEHGHVEIYLDMPTWEYPVELCLACFHECVHSPYLLRQSELMPGADEVLKELKDGGVELHLITHRPPELEYEVKRLLMRRQVSQYFSSVTITQEPKGVTADRLGLDVLLDDAPSVYFDVRQTSTLPIYFDQPYNRVFKGERVHSWREFLQTVMEPEVA